MFEDTSDTAGFETRPGKTGAARQSYAADNPRAVLDMLVAQHPTWDKEKLFASWCERMEENYRFRDSVYDYWFTNNHRSYKKPVAERVKHDEAAEQAAINDVIAQISLLTMVAPNGKALADCTGTECEKFGGWYIRVACRVGSRLVGAVLTEDDLREELARS